VLKLKKNNSGAKRLSNNLNTSKSLPIHYSLSLNPFMLYSMSFLDHR